MKNNLSTQDLLVFQHWLSGILKSQRVNVEFRKEDGSVRLMQATLNPTLLPPAEIKEDRSKKNPDVCVVWDLEKSAWRSFRYDRVISIGFTLE